MKQKEITMYGERFFIQGIERNQKIKIMGSLTRLSLIQNFQLCTGKEEDLVPS
jgi:hypothetical protein